EIPELYVFTRRIAGDVRRGTPRVTSDSCGKYSYDYMFTWKVRRIFPMGWRAARCCGHYCSDGQCRPYFRVVPGRHPIDGERLPAGCGRVISTPGRRREGRPTMTARGTPDRGGVPGDPEELMIPPEALPFSGAPSTACDGDPRCGHPACFQIQLEASQPQQAYRQAPACAYHVADVIEALRAWAREHDLAGGAPTIPALRPVAGGG